MIRINEFGPLNPQPRPGKAWKPQGTVRAWCHANQVELLFLPTYSSRLSWIEAKDG